MKVRIASLGEMDQEFVTEEIKRQSDYIVVSLKSVGEGPSFPIAVAANYSDIIKMFGKAIKLSVIFFLLTGWKSIKKPKPVGEF